MHTYAYIHAHIHAYIYQLRHFSKTVSVDPLGEQDDTILLMRPRSFVNVWVQVVVPSLSDLGGEARESKSKCESGSLLFSPQRRQAAATSSAGAVAKITTGAKSTAQQPEPTEQGPRGFSGPQAASLAHEDAECDLLGGPGLCETGASGQGSGAVSACVWSGDWFILFQDIDVIIVREFISRQ